MNPTQAPSPNKEQLKLMKYLDDFDRQINSRRGSSHALEEQLASLSKAYNQAQEQLLETERALMRESILLEKQRSVIDIYKYALSEELDEEGVLYFLQQLEQDEQNREIFEDIGEIRSVIKRKRLREGRRSSEEERASKDLKNQVLQLTQTHSLMLEEHQAISDKLQELQQHNQRLEASINSTQAELLSKSQALMETQRMLQQQATSSKALKEELALARKTIQRTKAIQHEASSMRTKCDSIERILKGKLGWGDKENQQRENSQRQPVLDGFVEGLERRVEQLLKYKAQYKKIKQNNQLTEFLKKEVTLLKLFLTEESLLLFKEFEQQKLECIETQIRNLAVLEKANLLQLQACQRDVWKYRIQLMKEEDQEGVNSSVKLSQTVKNRANFSKTSNLSGMMATLQQNEQGRGNISQFLH